MRYAGQLTPDEFWTRYAEMEQQVRATAGTLPGYGLAEWSGLRMIGDWNWENEHLVTVGLAHGDPAGNDSMVHVRTTTREPLQEVGSLRLAATGPARDKAEFVQRQRETEAVAGEPVTIPVDGIPVGFSVWREGERWWAAGSHAGHGLVLEAQRVPVGDVQLVRVDDIEPYLAGRRTHLRALRGET